MDEKRTYANDNEELSFITLAALTANVTRWLSDPHEKQDEKSSGNPDPAGEEKKRAEEQRRYVDHRLKEISAWERKISGKKN